MMLTEISDFAVIPSTFIQHLQMLPSWFIFISFIMTEEYFVEFNKPAFTLIVSLFPRHSHLNCIFVDKVSVIQINEALMSARKGNSGSVLSVGPVKSKE